MGSTRYDFTEIDPLEGGVVVGSAAGVTIVGGDTALGDADAATYVDWDFAAGSAGPAKGLRLGMPSITWPSGSGFAVLHVVVDGRQTLDPFPPYVNGGYNIDLVAVNYSFRDADGTFGPGDIVEVHPDVRVDSGRAHGWSKFSDFSGQFCLTNESFYSGLDESSLEMRLTLSFGFGGGYFSYRIYEAWIEVIDPSPSDDPVDVSPGPSTLRTFGFFSESVSDVGGGRPPGGANHGVTRGHVTNASFADFYPTGIAFWPDGRGLAVDFDYSLFITRMDGTGVLRSEFHQELFDASDGVSVLQGPGTALVFYDDWDQPDELEHRLHVAQYTSDGELLDEQIATYPGGPYTSPLEYDFHPSTGGVSGRKVIYLGNLGGGNGPNGEITFFAENLLTWDLDTGAQELLGSVDDVGVDTYPFSWLFGDEATGVPGDGSFISSMAVAPDGTYWFKLLGGGYLEPTLPSVYDPINGRYMLGVHLLHVDAAGTLIQQYDLHCSAEGGVIDSESGMAVGADGLIYWWHSASHVEEEGNDPTVEGDDEFDAVWFLDPAADYEPSSVTPGVLVEVEPWINLHMSTGIWAISNNVLVPMQSGFGVLKGMDLDNVLAWFDRPQDREAGRYKFKDDDGVMWVQQFPYHETVPDTTRTLKAMNDAGEVGAVGWFAPEVDELVLYWTDNHLNRWSETDGFAVYSPPGGPPSGFTTAVALFSADGEGGIIAFGVTERRGTVPDTYDAAGWQTTTDLVELDDFWLPETEADGEWVLPDGDKVGGYFITAYEGNAAHFDVGTGHIFVTGVWRRYNDVESVGEFAVLEIDPAVPQVVDTHVLTFETYTQQPTGLTNPSGQCVIGRKLYFHIGNGANDVGELDMDTSAFRLARGNWEPGRYTDMAVRPGDTTGLWLIEGFAYYDPEVYLTRFEVEDLSWGTTGSVTPTVEIPLYNEDTTSLIFGEHVAYAWHGEDQIVFWGYEWDSGNACWWIQTVGDAEPVILVDLEAADPDWFDTHDEPWQVQTVLEG